MRVPRVVAHPRAALTSDCVPHEAEHTVPCWCGATDAKARGLNVLSREPWSDECVFWFISWVQAAQKEKKSAA